MKIKAILLLGLLGVSTQALPTGSLFWARMRYYARISSNYMHAHGNKLLYGATAALLGSDVYFNMHYVPKTLHSMHNLQTSTYDSSRQLNVIRPFVDQELKKAEIQTDQVNVMFNSLDANPLAMRDNVLLLGKNECLDAKLMERKHRLQPKKVQVQAERKQQEMRAMLHHEFGHFKSNDVKKKVLQRDLMATGSAVSLGAVCAGIPSKKVQAAVFLGAAFPLYAFNKITGNAYSRYLEAKADEQIPQEQYYLQGAIRYLEKQQQYEDAVGANATRFSYYWNATHPTTISRIDRLKERLASLEQHE